MRRLKPNEVKAWREDMLKQQHGVCLVCGLPLNKENAVADHSHQRGWMRGVLHRGCNALLGKIENNHKRMGVPDLQSFLLGVWEYIRYGESEPLPDNSYHPSFRTEEEKRIRRNKRARLKRRKLKS